MAFTQQASADLRGFECLALVNKRLKVGCRRQLISLLLYQQWHSRTAENTATEEAARPNGPDGPDSADSSAATSGPHGGRYGVLLAQVQQVTAELQVR